MQCYHEVLCTVFKTSTLGEVIFKLPCSPNIVLFDRAFPLVMGPMKT